MCGCAIVLIIILLVQLYLISCGRGFILDGFIKSTKPNNPNQWKIDPITGLKIHANVAHSQPFPVVAKKLAVPKSWDDKSRHVRMLTYKDT